MNNEFLEDILTYLYTLFYTYMYNNCYWFNYFDMFLEFVYNIQVTLEY